MIYSQSFDEVKEIFKKARTTKPEDQLESKDTEEQSDEKKGDPSSSR